MATILTNNELIPSPAVGRLRYGIFTAAASTSQMSPRIIAAGGQFYADHCGDAVVYDAQCLPGTGEEKEFVEGAELMEFDPFWVLQRQRCGAVGRTAEEVQTAVRAKLNTGAQTQVESVMWDGDGLGTMTPTLTASGATVVTPGALGAGTAIAALEEAFYDVYGYVGTIHVNTQAYAAAAYSNLVLHDYQGAAGRLTTPLGSVWSFGSGYGITGPDEVAPTAGSVWAFMTGATHLWRSTIDGPDPRMTFDRTLNQWDVLAEEVWGYSWDCPEVFAVEIPIAAPAVSVLA